MIYLEMMISEYNKKRNKKEVEKILGIADKIEQNGFKVEVSDLNEQILNQLYEKGYVDDLPRNLMLKFTEYSSRKKESNFSTYRRGFSFKNNNDDDVSRKIPDSVFNKNNAPDVPKENNAPDVPKENNAPDVPKENNAPDVPKENNAPDVPKENNAPDVPKENNAPDVLKEKNTSNKFFGENQTEDNMTKKSRELNDNKNKIEQSMRSNLTIQNRYNMLYCTYTTKKTITDIKKFNKMLNKSFKKVGEEVATITVEHTENKIKRTYTYEHFSYIFVISCSLLGRLHAHCLFVFEGEIKKIAPKKNKDGDIEFDFENNAIVQSWKHGNVHIQHFLKHLDQETIDKIIEYFYKNFEDIKELKYMTKEEIREKAEKNVEKYLTIRKDYCNKNEDYCCNDIEITEKDKLTTDDEKELEEICYTNLCALREQQIDKQDGKRQRNRLIHSDRIVLKEDLTREVEYHQVKQYTKGMEITNQDVKWRYVNFDNSDTYKLQLSITTVYTDKEEFRCYENSANMFDMEYYRKVQRLRRQPVALPIGQEKPIPYYKMSSQQPIKALKQPLQTTQEELYYNNEDSYNNDYSNDYSDCDGYYDNVELLEDEELCSLYADEEDRILYEEIKSGMVSAT